MGSGSGLVSRYIVIALKDAVSDFLRRHGMRQYIENRNKYWRFFSLESNSFFSVFLWRYVPIS